MPESAQSTLDRARDDIASLRRGLSELTQWLTSPEAHFPQAEVLSRRIALLGEFDKALVLLYLDGNEYATIAGLLGISVSNVGTRLSRLKARLAESLRSAARRESGGHAS